MNGTKKGFSLIEVIAATVILTMVCLTVLGMFAFGSQSSNLNEDKLIVNNLLQWKAEEVLCKNFSVNVTESNTTFSGYSNYAFYVSQTTPYNGNNFLKMIDISINWTSPLGVTRGDVVRTLVANY